MILWCKGRRHPVKSFKLNTMKQSMKSLFEEVIEAEYQAYIADVKASYLHACAEAKAMQLRVQKQRLKEQRL